MPAARAEPQLNRGLLALLLAGLATIAPFTIDTYLPSFPAMAQSLAATPLQMQQTLSVYLIAYAFMMLFHGALSDSFGRRSVILISLAVFCAASVACALSAGLPQLLIFRALQGLSAGAGMVVGRAMIRDIFSGADAQRLMSTVTMIFAIAPAVAPVIGGWLQQLSGWRAVFWFLALFGATLLAACYKQLPETLPATARQPFALRPLAASYLLCARNARFIALILALALNFGGFFLYISSAPAFVYQVLGLGTTEFAWLFVPGIMGVATGAFLSGRLAGRIAPVATVKIAYCVMFTAVGINVLHSAWLPPAVPWSVLPVMLYTVGMSLAMPSISLLGLDLFPHNRGMAASLQGFAHSSGTAFVSGLISPLVSASAFTLACTMLALLLAGWMCWMMFLKLQARYARHA